MFVNRCGISCGCLLAIEMQFDRNKVRIKMDGKIEEYKKWIM